MANSPGSKTNHLDSVAKIILCYHYVPRYLVCSPVPMFHSTYVIMFHGTYVTRTYVPGISGVSRGVFWLPGNPPPGHDFFKLEGLQSLQADLSQFQDFVCPNAFASGAPPWTPLGGLQRRPPAGKLWVRPKMNPPLSKSWLLACHVCNHWHREASAKTTQTHSYIHWTCFCRERCRIISLHPGRNMSTCNVQRPIGLPAADSDDATHTDSVRMITLKIKFDANAQNGESVSPELVSPPNMLLSGLVLVHLTESLLFVLFCFF